MNYNDNGIIKKINVKAGDTLPIGTIVEIPGSTVPAGYSKVDDLSLEEVNEEVNILKETKQDKEWKLLFADKKKSDGILTLPEKFNELYIVVHQKTSATDAGNKYIFNIIYEVLTTALIDFVAGGYFTNAVNNGVIIGVSQTQIGLRDSYANGDYHITNPNSTFSVWYR